MLPPPLDYINAKIRPLLWRGWRTRAEGWLAVAKSMHSALEASISPHLWCALPTGATATFESKGNGWGGLWKAPVRDGSELHDTAPKRSTRRLRPPSQTRGRTYGVIVAA